MSHISYANEKLAEAVYIFTTHEGDARRRLDAAFTNLIRVIPTVLPEPFDDLYAEVMTEIGKIQSKHHIRNSTASDLIIRIVEIQKAIERLYKAESG